MTQVKDLKIIRLLESKPLRHCMTMHECCLCTETILAGQLYRDGGYGKRAHDSCVEQRKLLR